VASPLYPDVPLAPGVPPVLRDGQSSAVVQPLTGDDTAALAQYGPQWGIFTASGALAIEPDSFVALEVLSEYRISDYPVEGGQFESYNKVRVPYDLRLVVTKGGNDVSRLAFIAALDALIASLDFFSVATPDATYTTVNPLHYDFRRSAEGGVTLITADIQCRQVRADAKIAFTNSQTPSGTATVNDGPVQTTTAPADVGMPR
jgi:hypothetical protein